MRLVWGDLELFFFNSTCFSCDFCSELSCVPFLGIVFFSKDSSIPNDIQVTQLDDNWIFPCQIETLTKSLSTWWAPDPVINGVMTPINGLING